MRNRQNEKDRQEGFTRAEIAKQLGITTRTLDRRRERGHIVLTPVSEGRYLYTVPSEQAEETGTDEQRDDEQEPRPQEAATDQTTTLQSLLQSFRHSFRSTLDQDLDFIDEQIADLRKHANEQDAQSAAQDKRTDERLAALEDRITKLDARTDERFATLEKCIKILERIIRQHAEGGHQESKQ